MWSKYKYLKGNKQVIKIIVVNKDGSEYFFYSLAIIRDDIETFKGKLTQKRFETAKEAQDFLDVIADFNNAEWVGENKSVPVFKGTYRNFKRLSDGE